MLNTVTSKQFFEDLCNPGLFYGQIILGLTQYRRFTSKIIYKTKVF